MAELALAADSISFLSKRLELPREVLMTKPMRVQSARRARSRPAPLPPSALGPNRARAEAQLQSQAPPLFTASSFGPDRPVRFKTAPLVHAAPPVDSSRLGSDDVLELVHKTTRGFTEGELVQASVLGYDGWLEYQLDHESIDDSALEGLLGSLFPSLAMTAPELYATYWLNDDRTTPMNELRVAALARGILSQKQLFERMVEFWTDHFNISQVDSVATRLLKVVDDREVIRANALGSFPAMVHASAKSGAMIDYLDSIANVVGSPNENYSRELMELHTFGVDGPYNQNDVRELARCFTGWRFRNNPASFGEFQFAPQFHDFGEKLLLGTTIPAGGGVSDAETIIDLLVMHPTTAEFVSRKMIRWMLGYEPPQVLVDQTASIYLATGGDIKAMLRFILRRNHVLANVPFERRKLKRPADFVIGLLRQTQPDAIDAFELLIETFRLGQLPFNWGPPNGYPDTFEAWGGAVLARWSYATRYLDGSLITSVPNATLGQLLAGALPSEWATRISAFMTGGRLTQTEVSEIQAYIDARPATALTLRDAIALVASTPTYQYY